MRQGLFKLTAALIVMLFLGDAAGLAMGRRPAEEPYFPAETLNEAPVAMKFEDFIRLAVTRSETVKAAREEIKIARARTFQALGEAIGDGDFIMTHSRQEPQGNNSGTGSNVGSTLNAASRRERKFMFTQPLFQGFKSMGALLGSGNLKTQRSEELEFSKELLFTDAAEAYYLLISAEKNLEVLGESLKLFEDRITDLTEREEIGRSRPGEVAMARAKMKVLEARIARARGTLLSAQSLAWFYSGIPHMKAEDEDPETFSETVNIDPEHYVELADNRSDVAAAREAMGVAKQTIVVKQSGLWPHINLTANNYERREGFQDGISWDALITINVPLYRGGDNIGQILEAKSNYNKARLNYELVRKSAILEIEQTHQNWIAAREEFRAYHAAVEASLENFNYQREDYSKNLVSNLDVLAALEEYLNIREQATTTEYAMKINYWKLQIAANSRIPEWAEPAKDQKD